MTRVSIDMAHGVRTDAFLVMGVFNVVLAHNPSRAQSQAIKQAKTYHIPLPSVAARRPPCMYSAPTQKPHQYQHKRR